MPDVHALLSASSSKQWLHCPPSVRLQENFPNESSVYAEEGTFAHEICEYKVRRYLHERVKRPQSEEFDTEEIEQITDVYAEFVISIIEQMRENGCEPLAFVEERVDYSHIAPSGFGTADMLIIGKDENGRGLLHVCDFKTGKGVFVDADHNSQMMLYALGGLAAYGFLYDIEIVRMSIIQPRLDNISTFECSRQELEDWGESIKPTALLAFEGKGEQHPGDWCRFCRAKPVCKACADEALALCREDFLDLDAGAFDDTAEESDMTAPYEADTNTAVFKQPGLIAISELAEILPTLNRISSWIEAVFAFVSSEAINHGVRTIHSRKLEMLEDLIEAANGQPVLIGYWFKHDRTRIIEHLTACGYAPRDIKDSSDITDWNAGKIAVALIHPASAGHGLNIQSGGHILIWFGLTWSLELYQQTNARLWRQGQQHTVTIHHIVTKETVDEDVLKALASKDVTQEKLIAAVKARL